MKLFWVSTSDRNEDWFVVAETRKSAEIFHESHEGYPEYYAKGKFVCDIPDSLVSKYGFAKEVSDWPSLDLLKDLGANVISNKPPRIVNINGIIYNEGKSFENIAIKLASRQPGLYVVQTLDNKRYKIGISKNLRQRIKQFNTSNPDPFKVVFFVETKHYKSLEKHLHEVYKSKRIKGEWFELNDYDLENLQCRLELVGSYPKDFRFVNVLEISKKGGLY